MYRKCIFTVLVCAVAFCSVFFSASAARADRDENEYLRKMFGLGVHQYNAGQYMKAYESLTGCITGKTKDPSVYYFRGLALIQLGREEDAVVFRLGVRRLRFVFRDERSSDHGADLRCVLGRCASWFRMQTVDT